ncbi:NifB/NifX family molybdenum-iron cluster-binding protein [Elusimicrobiota bacterium]
MSVAVPTSGSEVSAHFEQCPSFTIAKIEDGQVKSTEAASNPGNGPGFLPDFLNDRGVDCVIAGDMAERAQALFARHNVQVVLGVRGPVRETLELFAAGSLAGGKSLCDPKSGKGRRLDKTSCDHGPTECKDGPRAWRTKWRKTGSGHPA